MKINYPGLVRLFFIALFLGLNTQLIAQINFGQSALDMNGKGSIAAGVTSMTYGPDGRLYVAEYPGTIKVMSILQNGVNDYSVGALENILGVKGIVNHDDDGTPCTGSSGDCTSRETTGLAVAGTAANPVIYVTSSDFRIGAGAGAAGLGDIDLDTNSGVITRLTWTGGTWEVVDLVRGLPRSEENHATNGLEFVNINGTNYLIVCQGGHTNGGSPSKNFVYTCEYALSAAILSVNLDVLNSMPVQTDGNGRNYIYDLPTLDDPTRANVNGISDPGAPGYNGIDINDPFGGNDGLNQAMLVPGGPVQIFSAGYRNSYDLVITQSGALYVTDNGANGGWGGFPENEGTANVTNEYNSDEPGSTAPAPDGEVINNKDHLQLITPNIQTYTPGSFYGGHPNPIRANPGGAGLYTNDGLNGGIFRTLIYDPSSPGAGFTADEDIALPANWASVVPAADPVQGDWRGPGLVNPEGPDDNPVTTWPTNTNGIDEYTASSFGGAMQGNLIAGSDDGILRRVELNADGSLDQLTTNFLSGISLNALAITCNGNADPFPGTIWAGTIEGNIVIFEPNDTVECIAPGEPGYDANADYDNDGYSNQDEEDNGTDPCNGGSQPRDFDKAAGAPLVSDLNDTDDDNDGIPDAEDPFQLGNPTAGGSDAYTLPIQNTLNANQGLGGLFSLGMTGLMNNGSPNPNWLEWLDDEGAGPNPDDVLGGAAGLMTSQMTSGTANGTVNTQEKGYQYGVQVNQTSGTFTVSGRLTSFNGALQLYGNTAATGGELGFFIGDGTQSNFIKFVITTAGLTVQQEINDVPQTPINLAVATGDRPDSGAVFYFIVNPADGNIVFRYAFDDDPPVEIGNLTAQGNILTALQQADTDLAVGFIGTSNTAGVELEGTWDFLDVVGSSPVVETVIPDVTRIVNSPDEAFNLNDYFTDDDGDGNLTYTLVSNTNPAIGAVIAGNTLTLSYTAVPEVTTITIRATDADTNFIEQTFDVTVTDAPVVLYRVNAGGPAIPAIDGNGDWGGDSKANPSEYLSQAGTNSTDGFGMDSYTPEVNQSTTPVSIFDTERFDQNQNPPNMTYSFPVPAPGNYEVRLYMGNGFNGTNDPGERIFDVTIDGVAYPALSDIDLSARFGHKVGTVITHGVYIDDGTIDIAFLHGSIENPLINGIEILDIADDQLPIYVFPVAEQTNNIGEELNGSLVVSAVGGDGNFSYSATGLPPGITIEPTNGQFGGTVDLAADAGSPYNVTITVDDTDAVSSDAVTTSFTWNIVDPTTYRINAGGAEVMATDDGTNWRYNGATGAYNGGIYNVNTGLIRNSGLLYADRDNSIPAYIDQTTFEMLFGEERYDDPSGPEMEFTLPLDNGDYMVNLYLGNSFIGTDGIGERIFDISVEGNVVRSGLDLIAEFGHKAGGMISFPVTLTDGVLNLQFLHDVENPLVNAIEIFEVDGTNPAFVLNEIPNQINGVNDDVSISAEASGGDPAENTTYYIAGQPEGISINPATGLISGTIGAAAITGGPNNDGNHEVVVTATKPGSAPATRTFLWSVGGSLVWVDKDENEDYTARHEDSFVQAGDKFYLMGGRENARTIDIYDYANNSWTSLTDSAPLEFNHFQATVYQGLIWVIGAFKDNNYPNEASSDFIWVFDPVNQEWIQGPEIPVGRRRGGAGLVLYNDKFYIVGGNTMGHSGGYVPYFDEYDPATGTWTQLPDAPRARDHFSAVLIGDSMYLAGGRQTGGPGGVFSPTIPEVDVYNFVSGTWGTLPAAQNLPTQRAGAATVNFNGNLVVIGGETPVSGPSQTTTESLNPGTGTWSTLAALNHPRHGTQAIVSGNGIFITAGSPNQGDGSQKNMEYLGVDAPVGTPGLASALSAPSGVLIADGTTGEIPVSITGGNVGIFVTSMDISGPDAADFSVVGGELTNQLLAANGTHTISVELTGTGEDRNAVLTIHYGNDSTLDIALSNSNAPPVAIAEASPLSGSAPLEVQFTGSNSTDDKGIVSYQWDFMDDSATSSEANPLHNFTTDGTYNVMLTVTDGSGLTDTAVVTITVGEVSNMPPVAVIEATPSSGVAPLEVNFVGRNSSDDFGIAGYSWDFGDGTSSAAVDPTHTFASTGEYLVVLTVTDAEGLTNSTSVTILVEDTDGNMRAIILENPALDGLAKIRVINKPGDLIIKYIYLHDSSGRFIRSFNAQEMSVTGGTYEVPVGALRDGLYFVGLEMSQGDPLLVKLLVKN